MPGVELFSIIASVASITLAVVSIWLAKSAVRDSQHNYEKTSKTLNGINERSAGTEKIVGEHFDKMMETVLNIVNSATTGPEVRKAEIEMKRYEEQAKTQERLFKIMEESLGDSVKLQRFFETMERFTKLQGR